MATDLVHPIPNASPETAISLSQKAPPLLKSSTTYPWPLSLFLSSESQDQWTTIENLFISCLRTGDDESARQLLDKLIDRFGEKNERVMAYSGMYAESRIENEKDFVNVLKEYGEALDENPANIHLQKRRIALLRSRGRLVEATHQLVHLCDISPTDAEAWSELASAYIQQNLFDQAIFALEEVLLIMPNAWNMHARLAEVIVKQTESNKATATSLEIAKGYAEAVRRYLRSIELCDNYLRAYYGLKLVTKKLMDFLPQPAEAEGLPSRENIETLNEISTLKLWEIVKRSSNGEPGWAGNDKAELIATREILDADEVAILKDATLGK